MNQDLNEPAFYARLPEEALEAHRVCDAFNQSGVACYVRRWHLDQTGWFVVNAETYERMNFSHLVSEMPKQSIRNRRLVLQAVKQNRSCGCYFCLNTWEAVDITHYLPDQSALCPNCNVDSILVDVTDPEALGAGLERWFTASSPRQLEPA